MPVYTVLGDKADKDPKSGKPYRHVNPTCKGYTKHDASARSGPVRNTAQLRDRTVRCPLAGDWDVWEKEQDIVAKRRAERGAKAGTSAGKTSGAKAGKVAAVAQGGKGATLADKAKAARQKPKPKATAGAK